jgi:hypothetical protein
MSQETLWDFLDRGGDRETYLEACDRDETRKRAIKRLRAGGHWLTLLRVARAIPQPFTLNDISVAVWRACPDFFGMKGYPYPDNHKVHYILYGSRGLIARGIIHRVREGLFCVAEGIDAEAILAGAGQPDVPRGTKRSAAEFMQ